MAKLKTKEACIFTGCERLRRGKGYCTVHYWRQRNAGLIQPRHPAYDLVCNVSGCDRPYRSRGYCVKHYSRWLAHGTTDLTPRSRGICKVEGCGGRIGGQGYCPKHYGRYLRHGDPEVVTIRVRRECKFEGCTTLNSGYGYCNKHYRRLVKHGDPTYTSHHKRTRTPEYYDWSSMKARCLNPNNPSYRIYGGAGITIADSWVSSFITFFKDMGPKPTNNHSLMRKDRNGDFTPENCYWGIPWEH